MTGSATGPEVTLALGGGGARGISHLGVLEVLQELGVRVRSIVGTSAGAIVGAGFALQPDAKALTRRVLAYFEGKEFARLGINMPLHRPGESGSFQHLLRGFWRRKAMAALFKRNSIFRGELLRRLVGGLLGDATFEDAKIPIAITALDLRSGQEAVLREGSLREAVLASSSVSGFFPPVERDGALLVDFGLLNRLPVQVAYELGGPPVIAVNVAAKLPPPGPMATGIEVILRTEEIGAQFVNGYTHREADLVVSPLVGHRYWLDFTDLSTAVERGREAALLVAGKIRSLGSSPVGGTASGRKRAGRSTSRRRESGGSGAGKPRRRRS